MLKELMPFNVRSNADGPKKVGPTLGLNCYLVLMIRVNPPLAEECRMPPS